MSDVGTEPVEQAISPEDREAIEKLLRATTGEVELLDEALSPDWRGFPAPGVEVKADALKPIVAAFATAFPDAQVTVHDIVATPGHVAIRAEVTGTHKGDWLGVPATNKSCVIAMHAFHHVEDGRVVRSWPLDDIFGWMQQVKDEEGE
jgi:steroid delta-isomerase-like uncharacterized protein